MANNIDLVDAFRSWHLSRKVCENLLKEADADPAVALLALEGLWRIESTVKRGQFAFSRKGVADLLQRWRNENDLYIYSSITKKVLKELTIFKNCGIPLFIDNYGKKNLISSYEETVDVAIGLDEPIYHVTHLEEAQKIVSSNSLKASDNKNIIKGSWFGLWSPQSVYGSQAFGTTLSELNVGGLLQGEIVSYKQEVNVILYADDEGNTDRPKRPTDKAAKEYHGNDGMYVKVSIFVPEKFLPEPQDFGEVIRDPIPVLHTPFCVREKRTGNRCAELN
ncbi:uncharacterized protein [Montipora capricornis]|uniref:uncharacterized protein n=1 Tax=Montipora capricornis TaxID=246305 RepID=UPI0035F16A0A